MWQNVANHKQLFATQRYLIIYVSNCTSSSRYYEGHIVYVYIHICIYIYSKVIRIYNYKTTK